MGRKKKEKKGGETKRVPIMNLEFHLDGVSDGKKGGEVWESKKVKRKRREKRGGKREESSLKGIVAPVI